MSIYATHWTLKFPRHGDTHTGCEWVEVWGQGVPAHIGTPTPGEGYEEVDPFADFLPPAVPVRDDDDGTGLRAMVIVRRGTEKVIQQYVNPLLVLSGEEYKAMPFEELYRQICDALRANHPHCVAESYTPDGQHRLLFSDGSERDLPPDGDDRA
ncbi:MAG: hypothetical protein WD851_00730 [Pirellulales bacterium]